MENKQTHTNIYRNIHHGKNVMIAMSAGGITQEGLAVMLDVSQKQVSRFIHSAQLDDELLEKIAKAMNIDVNFLKEFSNDLISNFHQSVQNVAENGNGTMENQNNYISGDFKETKYPVKELQSVYDKLIHEKDLRIKELNEELKQKDILLAKHNLV